MNVSQQLNEIHERQYDDDITVSDLPTGHFPAVTGIRLPDGATTREISVEILPLEQQQQSTMTINSGMYVRQDGETAVKVTVSQNGATVAENTQYY